jgi:hypothetical protein
VGSQDWRVQIATIIVDGLIVLGVFVMLGLHVLDTTIGVALLSTLIGARVTALKPRLPEGAVSAVSNNAGGALALLLVIGTGLVHLLRARGPAALVVLVLGGASIAACASSARTVTGDVPLETSAAIEAAR